MLKTLPFVAQLSSPLEKGARYLPLSASDEAGLKAILPEGDYTYLTLTDPVGSEIVKVTNTCDTLLVDRGQDGTEDRKFPRGTCVKFSVSPAVVKELICTHDCCEGGCPCEDVTAAGYSFPAATTGVRWEGSVIFTGDTPMQMGVTGMPDWMQSVSGANYVVCSGVPTGAGTFTVSVAATNCSGAVAVQQCVLVVQ